MIIVQKRIETFKSRQIDHFIISLFLLSVNVPSTQHVFSLSEKATGNT